MTSSPPLVTVLVPAFNAARYIDETLESARTQTISDLEILVIDDGSKDETSDLIRRWQEKDLRIRLISQANGGVSSARNRGLREAKAGTSPSWIRTTCGRPTSWKPVKRV